MKVTKKPARKKIVVALLGLCLAVSSYTVSTAKALSTRGQTAPAVQNATGGAQSQLWPFWNPFWPFYYGYYYYYTPYYYTSFYYQPYYQPYFYSYYY